jgi:hypothetical protein
MALQNQEFLELTIPLDKLSAEDKETVTAFNRRFPPHDAYLETSGHLVVLKLKQLDFGRLEELKTANKRSRNVIRSTMQKITPFLQPTSLPHRNLKIKFSAATAWNCSKSCQIIVLI